jgi:hypothetical protein
MLAVEIRSARSEMDRVCRNDPSSPECIRAKMSYDGAVLRYRGLMTEAPTHCRSGLQDPIAF